MSVEAGGVNIVLGLNAATYTESLKQAQRQIDEFAGKTRQAGHSTVSSMQASSAAIREMNGDFTRNTRAVERFITTIPGVGKVLQAAFPLVGGVAFASMIAEAGIKVADFVKKIQEMPKAIQQGFAALNLAGQTSVDQLRLTNDTLQNTIDKLQGKPQNNTKIALDEARLSADKLAESILSANTKLNDLLSKDHLTGWALLMGQRGTADREGTVKYYGQQQDDAALRIQQSVASGDKNGEAKARTDLKSSQDSELKNMLLDIESQKAGQKAGAGDGSANIAIDTGVATSILTQQNQQAEQARNAALVPQERAAQEAKAAQEKAKAAALKAAEAFRKGLDDQLEVNKAYERLSEDMAKATVEHNQDFYKSNGLSDGDSKSLNDAGKSSLARITAMSQTIALSKQNSDAIAESSLQMAVATGQMTRLDAARVVATMHLKQYSDALTQLQDQAKAIANDPQYNNHEEGRQAASLDNQNRQTALRVSYSIQSAQDNQSVDPASSSPFVGATDALNEFVIASRDAAKQISEFTTSTINGFNDVLIHIMSTRSTGLQNRQALGNYGAGLARSVAGMGLQHAEGSALGMLGFGGGGKMGTQANPMWTRSVDIASNAIGTAGSFVRKMFGGGGSSGSGASGLASVLGKAGNAYASDQNNGGIGTIASTLTDMIPFLASGGPISGPAIVGEQGPELFVPSGTGNIIPNHKLTGSNNGHTINIDATGSTDPAQTQAAVVRGITAAAPHIMAGAVRLGKDQQRRTSSRAR